MDAAFTPADEAFREEVRAFFKAKLLEHIRRQAQLTPSYVPKDHAKTWHRILYEQGWIAPRWPVEHGGTGWTPVQRHIFEEEYQRAYAPRLSAHGLGLVGPVIYTFGTPEQKAEHLPPILSGDRVWCQGYSEPGAGSDLASLKTRAVLDGDHYVVNGQKIWTSHAHHADWIFCLVRTSNEGKKQEGITFLLIDMTTPGVEVRPIISIDKGHYLNETFFTDVRVPVANRIGEENKGWTYAKFLLGNERTGIAGVGKSRRKIEKIAAVAREERGSDGRTLWDDAAFRGRLMGYAAKLNALETTNLRMLSRDAAGHKIGAESSMLKIAGTEIEQGLNELLVEAIGNYAAPYERDSLRIDANEFVGPDHGRGAMTEHLLRRAASIYGGTNEIQRDIMAKRVLGL